MTRGSVELFTTASINPFIATLTAPSLKNNQKSPKFEILKNYFSPFALASERVCTEMHSSESRYVIGQLNSLFRSICVGTFQPENVAGRGGKGVNPQIRSRAALKLGQQLGHIRECPRLAETIAVNHLSQQIQSWQLSDPSSVLRLSLLCSVHVCG